MVGKSLSALYMATFPVMSASPPPQLHANKGTRLEHAQQMVPSQEARPHYERFLSLLPPGTDTEDSGLGRIHPPLLILSFPSVFSAH